ncbi:hypothetical protein EDB84DRAFT_1562543 [Lactarius hengduanensis]|nr:hypothetical protein EDB84DRAFT_1562543 [Lactarius hengduanensis]
MRISAMLSSSRLFLSSSSSLDDTNNTNGGDKEVARAPDDIKVPLYRCFGGRPNAPLVDAQVNCLETGITSEHSSSEDVPAQPAQLADGPIDGHLHLLTSRCTVRPRSDVSEQWDLMRRKTPTRMRPRMFLHDNGRAPFPPSTSSSRADSAAIDRGFQTSDWTHRLV